MAMRLYSEEEFDAELVKKWKLSPTKATTKHTSIWKTPKGKHISIPRHPAGEPYPDCYIDILIQQLDAMGENPIKPPKKAA